MELSRIFAYLTGTMSEPSLEWHVHQEHDLVQKFDKLIELRGIKRLGLKENHIAVLDGNDISLPPSIDMLSLNLVATNIEKMIGLLQMKHQRLNMIYTTEGLHQYHRTALSNQPNLDRTDANCLWSFDFQCDRFVEHFNSRRPELEAIETDAFCNWEHHDPQTLIELIEKRNEGSNKASIDAIRDIPEIECPVYEVSSEDICSLVSEPPASRFKDALSIDFIGSCHLIGLDDSMVYKNNLSAVIHKESGEPLLVLATFTTLLFYEFNPSTHKPMELPPIFQVDLETSRIENFQLVAQNWQQSPHIINFIKVHHDWLEGEVLAVCCDDGMVYIFLSKSLLKLAISTSDRKFDLAQSRPFYKLLVRKSVWAVDFASVRDSKGISHYILATGSNARMVELYYFNACENKFQYICSDLLFHNVPEVSFVSYSEFDGKHKAIISCVSISSDVVTICFTWRMDKLGDSVDIQSIQVDSLSNSRVYREAWTTKAIDGKFFKKVHSFEELIGNYDKLMTPKESQVLMESSVISTNVPNPKFSSSLGMAVALQALIVPTVHLRKHEGIEPARVSMMFRDLSYNSLEKELTMQKAQVMVHSNSMALKFIVASSDSHLYLYRADSLTCCAKTEEIFTEVPYPPDRALASNRILITAIIPELSCVIAATQLGLLSIMRLCQYRGVYGMRQEHLFPHFSHIQDTKGVGRTLVGLAIKKLSTAAVSPRYFIYVTYIDGRVLCYRLRDKSMDMNSFLILP